MLKFMNAMKVYLKGGLALSFVFFFLACEKKGGPGPDGSPNTQDSIPVQSRMGAIDSSFEPKTGANWPIHQVIVQPDNKILIAGAFTSFDGKNSPGIARLLPNGKVDASFQGSASHLWCMTLQPDGKILIGGDFVQYAGQTRYRFARIHPDGTLDNSFNTTGVTLFSGAPGLYAIALQPDGKILIGGNFSAYDGEARYSFARVNADGSLDESFNMGVAGSVRAIAVQEDGKILLGGSFAKIAEGCGGFGIARVHPDGSPDTTFKSERGFWAGGGGNTSSVRSIVLQPDGKILVGGLFERYDDHTKSGIVRLNADGSLDASFTGVGTEGGGIVDHISVEPNGQILISGRFSGYRGTGRNGICRINADGTLDNNFSLRRFDKVQGGQFASSIFYHAMQTDRKLIVVGEFGSYDQVTRNRIVRVHTE